MQCTLQTVKARKLNFGDHFFRDNAHSVGEAIGLNSSLLSGPIMQRSHNTDLDSPLNYDEISRRLKRKISPEKTVP